MIGSVPNIFNTQAPPWDIAQLDADFAFITNYIDTREITEGTLAARPSPGNAGTLYFATDDYGGTLYFDNGVNWVQVTAGLTSPSIISFIDVPGIQIADNGLGTYQTVSNDTIAVPKSSQVMIFCTMFAHQIEPGGGTAEGTMRLRAGTGGPPPVASAEWPLHIFQSTTYVGFSANTLVAFPWVGGPMNVILEAAIEIGGATIEWGTSGADARFERSYTIYAYR